MSAPELSHQAVRHVVSNWIGLPEAEFKTLVVLAHLHMAKTDSCRYGIEKTLAPTLNVTDRTVSRRLRKLEQAGAIVTIERIGTSSEYRFPGFNHGLTPDTSVTPPDDETPGTSVRGQESETPDTDVTPDTSVTPDTLDVRGGVTPCVSGEQVLNREEQQQQRARDDFADAVADENDADFLPDWEPSSKTISQLIFLKIDREFITDPGRLVTFLAHMEGIPNAKRSDYPFRFVKWVQRDWSYHSRGGQAGGHHQPPHDARSEKAAAARALGDIHDTSWWQGHQ